VSFFAFQDIITCVTGIMILIVLIISTQMSTSPPGKGPGEDVAGIIAQLRDSENRLSNLTREIDLLQQTLSPMNGATGLKDEIQELQKRIRNEKAKLKQVEATKRLKQREEAQSEERLGISSLRTQINGLKQEIDSYKSMSQMITPKTADLEKKVSAAEAALQKVRQDNSKVWVIPDSLGMSKQPILIVLSENGMILERFNKPEDRVDLGPDIARLKETLGKYDPKEDYVVFYIKPSGIRSFQTVKDLSEKLGFDVGYDAVEESKEIVFSNKSK
jgi:DNA repair exonuclease SbcCD ATPase subunit